MMFPDGREGMEEKQARKQEGEEGGGEGDNRRMGGEDKNWTNVGNLGEFCFFWCFPVPEVRYWVVMLRVLLQRVNIDDVM